MADLLFQNRCFRFTPTHHASITSIVYLQLSFTEELYNGSKRKGSTNTHRTTALLGTIHISREEVSYSVNDSNSYYTADLINLLLYPLNQSDTDIEVYPAVTPEQLTACYQKIRSQKQPYGFIPLNVAYDKKDAKRKNHWVALVIDKQNKLMFYLDPAQKNTLSKEVDLLKAQLDYHSPTIFNPIDFQKNEKDEGWLRHCGVYIVEIFAVFNHKIQKNQYIFGSKLSDTTDTNENINSVSVATALSDIPCGVAENTKTLREKHIDEAFNLLVRFNPSKLKKQNGSWKPPLFQKNQLKIKPIKADDISSIPAYVREFFSTYQNQDCLLPLLNDELFQQQKEIGTKKLQEIQENTLKLEGFLAKFYRPNFFDKASPFCQKVTDIIKASEILLAFDRNQAVYKKNHRLDKPNVWDKCQYELFCMKHFCVRTRKSPDDSELREFINRFIEKTDRTAVWLSYDFLVTELKNLRVEYEKNEIEINRDSSFMPPYVNDFFDRYKHDKVYILPLYNREFFEKRQKKMGAKNYQGFKPNPPKERDGFLFNFHQDRFFEKASHFCQEIRKIILNFEQKHMYYTEPQDANKSRVWKHRHYELFCMKYLCVEVATSIDDRELKEFIDEFIEKTDRIAQNVFLNLLNLSDTPPDYNSLINDMSNLIEKFEKRKIDSNLSLIVHDETKKIAQIVRLSAKVDALEAEKSRIAHDRQKDIKDKDGIIKTLSDEIEALNKKLKNSEIEIEKQVTLAKKQNIQVEIKLKKYTHVLEENIQLKRLAGINQTLEELSPNETNTNNNIKLNT